MRMTAMKKERLTGRSGMRQQRITGKFILTVEVSESSSYYMECPKPAGVSDEYWMEQEAKKEEASWREARRFWRDATAADVISLAARGGFMEPIKVEA